MSSWCSITYGLRKVYLLRPFYGCLRHFLWEHGIIFIDKHRGKHIIKMGGGLFLLRFEVHYV